MFYPSKVHTLASESEAGKTWAVLAAAFDEMKAGKHVLYCDFEDTEEGIVGRLLTFGLPKDAINERFHYIKPTQSVNNEVNLADLMDVINGHQPTLAVIDGITEAMTMHGLNPNDNSEIARFGEMLPRKIARSGPATVCLDHVVKNGDSRGRYALGGVHKLNGLDGAAYILEQRDPFGVGITGRSAILIAKDRPGQLRKHARRRNDGLFDFAEFTLDSHDDTYAEFEIKPAVARQREFRPTIVMAKISKVYETRGRAMSQRDALALVGGKAETARMAFGLLRKEGYLSESTPHKLLRPYRGDEDA
ncbi:DNA primase [Mycobacterium mantenii]|uniref:DNA primase n=1 Tax=Mycobacterium mantenii TaxID=560555 RepID=A0A1X0G105_MYCNT|nr:DNA primase [Mycobacterium mantenii]